MKRTDISKENLLQFIDNALKEDVGIGDYTSLACVPFNKQGEAKLLAKSDGIIAGVELAEYIFHQVNPNLKIKTFIEDGSVIKNGDVVFIVSGSEQSILTAERLVLNCMQRMSGIATMTNRFVQKLNGSKTKITDTRKTTPNNRSIEKWAVAIGGGHNHRHGLYDMILIKDNHVDCAGGIVAAIEAANLFLKKNNLMLPIEIETRNLDEINQVLICGKVQRIMLDNFSPEKAIEAIGLINGKFEVEISGGITLENIHLYKDCGADYISVGALTHSVMSLDMSLKIIKPTP